jgi:hypothetical protein
MMSSSSASPQSTDTLVGNAGRKNKKARQILADPSGYTA